MQPGQIIKVLESALVAHGDNKDDKGDQRLWIRGQCNGVHGWVCVDEKGETPSCHSSHPFLQPFDARFQEVVFKETQLKALMFFYFPTIIMAMQSLFCVEVGSNHYLGVDTAIKCWSPDDSHVRRPLDPASTIPYILASG